ncbi:MAG: hypothetical protein HYZ75_04810 [Elusimicrobia bacterium]|nr:hypothetical protein [Elusimicrobiota bacterium]
MVFPVVKKPLAALLSVLLLPWPSPAAAADAEPEPEAAAEAPPVEALPQPSQPIPRRFLEHLTSASMPPITALRDIWLQILDKGQFDDLRPSLTAILADCDSDSRREQCAAIMALIESNEMKALGISKEMYEALAADPRIASELGGFLRELDANPVTIAAAGPVSPVLTPAGQMYDGSVVRAQRPPTTSNPARARGAQIGDALARNVVMAELVGIVQNALPHLAELIGSGSLTADAYPPLLHTLDLLRPRSQVERQALEQARFQLYLHFARDPGDLAAQTRALAGLPQTWQRLDSAARTGLAAQLVGLLASPDAPEFLRASAREWLTSTDPAAARRVPDAGLLSLLQSRNPALRRWASVALRLPEALSPLPQAPASFLGRLSGEGGLAFLSAVRQSGALANPDGAALVPVSGGTLRVTRAPAGNGLRLSFESTDGRLAESWDSAAGVQVITRVGLGPVFPRETEIIHERDPQLSREVGQWMTVDGQERFLATRQELRGGGARIYEIVMEEGRPVQRIQRMVLPGGEASFVPVNDFMLREEAGEGPALSGWRVDVGGFPPRDAPWQTRREQADRMAGGIAAELRRPTDGPWRAYNDAQARRLELAVSQYLLDLFEDPESRDLSLTISSDGVFTAEDRVSRAFALAATGHPPGSSDRVEFLASISQADIDEAARLVRPDLSRDQADALVGGWVVRRRAARLETQPSLPIRDGWRTPRQIGTWSGLLPEAVQDTFPDAAQVPVFTAYSPQFVRQSGAAWNHDPAAGLRAAAEYLVNGYRVLYRNGFETYLPLGTGTANGPVEQRNAPGETQVHAELSLGRGPDGDWLGTDRSVVVAARTLSREEWARMFGMGRPDAGPSVPGAFRGTLGALGAFGEAFVQWLHFAGPNLVSQGWDANSERLSVSEARVRARLHLFRAEHELAGDKQQKAGQFLSELLNPANANTYGQMPVEGLRRIMEYHLREQFARLRLDYVANLLNPPRSGTREASALQARLLEWEQNFLNSRLPSRAPDGSLRNRSAAIDFIANGQLNLVASDMALLSRQSSSRLGWWMWGAGAAAMTGAQEFAASAPLVAATMGTGRIAAILGEHGTWLGRASLARASIASNGAVLAPARVTIRSASAMTLGEGASLFNRGVHYSIQYDFLHGAAQQVEAILGAFLSGGETPWEQIGSLASNLTSFNILRRGRGRASEPAPATMWESLLNWAAGGSQALRVQWEAERRRRVSDPVPSRPTPPAATPEPGTPSLGRRLLAWLRGSDPDASAAHDLRLAPEAIALRSIHELIRTTPPATDAADQVARLESQQNRGRALSNDDVALGNRLLRELPADHPLRRRLENVALENQRLRALENPVPDAPTVPYTRAKAQRRRAEVQERVEAHLRRNRTLAYMPDAELTALFRESIAQGHDILFARGDDPGIADLIRNLELRQEDLRQRRDTSGGRTRSQAQSELNRNGQHLSQLITLQAYAEAVRAGHTVIGLETRADLLARLPLGAGQVDNIPDGLIFYFQATRPLEVMRSASQGNPPLDPILQGSYFSPVRARFMTTGTSGQARTLMAMPSNSRFANDSSVFGRFGVPAGTFFALRPLRRLDATHDDGTVRSSDGSLYGAPTEGAGAEIYFATGNGAMESGRWMVPFDAPGQPPQRQPSIGAANAIRIMSSSARHVHDPVHAQFFVAADSQITILFTWLRTDPSRHGTAAHAEWLTALENRFQSAQAEMLAAGAALGMVGRTGIQAGFHSLRRQLDGLRPDGPFDPFSQFSAEARARAGLPPPPRRTPAAASAPIPSVGAASGPQAP